MSQSTVFPPLLDLPFTGPLCTADWCVNRVEVLGRQARQLRGELGPEHPQFHLARSWFAVVHGAEFHDDALLYILQRAEPVIRQHYPHAVRALVMNLACQGFHTWFLHDKEDAIAPLSEAYQLMLAHGVAIEADVVKVAEVLADCLASTEAHDEALGVLYAAQPYLLAAIEQNEFAVAQYEEFREGFVDECIDTFSAENKFMVAVLQGPRLRQSFANTGPDLSHD